MDGYCTCGAKLPDDAMFCHRCGRPQRDDLIAVEEPVAEPSAPQPPLIEIHAVEEPAPPVNFHNGPAVRVSVIAALLTFFLMFPAVALGGGPFQLMVTFLGGFLAVHLYRRRVATEVTVVSGARVGWLTGIFLFMLFTVLTTLGMALMSSNQELLAAYETQMRDMGASGDAAKQMVEVMRNPGGFALFLAGLLIYLFMMSTLLCSLGGALSAKLFTASKR